MGMMREDFTQAQIENQWEDLFGRSGMSTPLDIRAQRERQRTATNPFSSFLPSGGAMQGATPAKERFYRQSFSDIYNRYLGELGKQAREGELPSMSFREYMATDPLTTRYQDMLPQDRAYFGSASTQQFAPRTRQIFY